MEEDAFIISLNCVESDQLPLVVSLSCPVFLFDLQSVIRMSGFRSLAEGEEVELETKLADKGVEATFVTGPGGSDCRGTQRHSNASKKTLKSKRIR